MKAQPQPCKGDILVVDDNLHNLRLLSGMLGEQGYKVRPATDGPTALKAVQLVPPDLILLDVKMPEIDGYEVCRRLKADTASRDVPIIFVSAVGEVPDKVRGFAVGGVDYVTKPFQAEELLMRIRTHLTLHKLQRKLQEANQDLSAQKEEAIQANQAKSRFLAAASHDLRQPLHALTLFVDALDERIRDAETREVLDKTRQCVESLGSLFNALLDVSRLDAGTVTPERKHVSLSELLAQLETEFASETKAMGLEFVYEPHHAVIHSDPVLLKRILRNLLSNALKYTQRGEIRLQCQREGEQLHIAVCDTGCGIPADQQEAVFMEFYQLGNPERDRCKGLGLGLSIVKRLAQLLGHPLSVTSSLGKGSTFTLSVPISQERAERLDEDLREQGQNKSADRILVIDNEALIGQATVLLLKRLGYQVLAVDSADAALQQMMDRDWIPDVIISDYRLRFNQTGVEAIQRIQAQCDNHIPAILVTGDTSPACSKDARDNDYHLLHKPVKPARLASVIRYCLRER